MVVKLPKAPTFNYAPVNHCIYCGHTDGELTKEHIIPRGLHGNLVLPKSSCKTCATVTSEIERRVLRGFLEYGRRAMGISSRHKDHWKSQSVPVNYLAPDDSSHEGDMPIEGGFHTIHLPLIATPLALGGTPHDNNLDALELVGMDTLHIGNIKEAILNRGATGVKFETKVDIWPFARMLAKIAYCYYVAEKGSFPRGESPILPVAMEHSNHARQWIGCLEDHPLVRTGSNALHLMDITEIAGQDGSICSVVRIKLFSTNAGPTYAVIARIHK